MEIAESKAMGSIDRGGKLGTEEVMWRGIGAWRWSVGIEKTLVISHYITMYEYIISHAQWLAVLV